MLHNLKIGIMHLVRRPDNLLILAALLILIIPFIFWGESVVINILGFTVFIDGKTIIYVLVMLMIAYWIVYRTLSRFLLNKSLTWIHLIITIGLVAYFLGTGTWFLKSKATSKVEANILGQLTINKERMISVTSLTGIIFILGQLALVSNLSIGLQRTNINGTQQKL